MSTKTTRLLIGLTGVILVLGGTTYAIAAQNDEERTAESRAGSELVTRCTGGFDEGVSKLTNDLPSIINEGALLNIPNAAITLSVPANDSDLFQVVFHGEAELENASVSSPGFNNDDRLELQAQVVSAGGVVTALAPVGPISFAGSNDQEAHAASWCVRLGAGTWTFRIQARVLDVGPVAVVRAQLDDTELEVRRYN